LPSSASFSNSQPCQFNYPEIIREVFFFFFVSFPSISPLLNKIKFLQARAKVGFKVVTAAQSKNLPQSKSYTRHREFENWRENHWFLPLRRTAMLIYRALRATNNVCITLSSGKAAVFHNLIQNAAMKIRFSLLLLRVRDA